MFTHIELCNSFPSFFMSLSTKQPPAHSNSKIFTEDVNPNLDGNSIIQSLEPLVCLKSCQIRPAVRAIAVLELFYAIIAASLLKSFRNCDNGTRICKLYHIFGPHVL
ncbi:hypothetical protein T10_13114 [Trichinella papuae]|uniref:Uncharacterized protein n=1 Tax=Trichinella papuae TaxID=268474 RepID=A0A0V1MF61_9BILA|nr:hypothetical protein T10_13114 [Trichinella papuae]